MGPFNYEKNVIQMENKCIFKDMNIKIFIKIFIYLDIYILAKHSMNIVKSYAIMEKI